MRSHFVASCCAILALLPSTLLLPTTSAAMTLPPRLQRAMSKGLLSIPRPDLYVLGTVHIGSESAEEASALIEHVRPRAVVLEVPPSRVERIRRKNDERRSRRGSGSSGDGIGRDDPPPSAPPPGLLGAFFALPSLAARGWSTGGLSGLLFSTAIVWSSLLKRSTTLGEESETLPRRDEFAATIEAADSVGARVVPADVEIDELIGSAARALSASGWARLGAVVAAESLGLRPVDPVRRRRGETVAEWAERRRDVRTARSSRRHGQEAAAELSKVLVDERDGRFAERCGEILASSGGGTRDGRGAVVCVVGLVHLDGVVDRLLGTP